MRRKGTNYLFDSENGLNYRIYVNDPDTIIIEDKNNIIIDKIKTVKFDKDSIKDVKYNDPATIVFWKDGTKTVVKCQKNKGDTYNPELGLAMCIIKKMCGNKGNYNDMFNKWLPK